MASKEIFKYLEDAVNLKASDILLVADSAPTIRVGGALIELNKEPLTGVKIKEIVYGILNESQIKRLEDLKDLDLAVETDDGQRFRVNVHFQKDSIAAAFRTIPLKIPDPRDLNVPDVIHDFATEPRGLILVTGATGSGKTTTQAMIIDIINSSQKSHIITVEDPIEFIHRNKKSVVEQREVGIDSPSFSSALKYVLRQNPNVILVGEMRDIETISTAITAAETGHLVISTLHTNDAVQTIDRIIDVFPPHQQQQVRMQLSLALAGVISQQLVPKADGTGVVLATEVLKPNPSVRNLIRKGHSHEIYSVVETSKKYGMHSMDQSLAELARNKKIALQTAVNRAHNPEHIERLLGGQDSE